MRNRYWGLLADLVAIVCFAAMGRSAHHEALDVAGVAETAWPFLAGALVGWVMIRTYMRRWPVWKAGFVVWADTLVLGMLLRLLAGHGTHWSFVLVAAVSLLILLLGWRLVWWFTRGRALEAERRERRRQRVAQMSSDEA